MEFIVSRNILLQALNHARTVMVPKYATPLFGHFFFTFSDDANIMTVHASDGDIWFSEHIALNEKAVDPRPVSVWYGEILRALKSLDEQLLTFDVGESQMTVRHSCGQFRVPLGENTWEYFSMTEYKRLQFDDMPCEHAEFEAPGLYSVLNMCKTAMADDELRPVLNGIYFKSTDEYTDFVASEGHRLIRVRKAPMESDIFSLIIPRKVVLSLLRILPATGDVFLDHRVVREKVDGMTKDIHLARFVIDGAVTVAFYPYDGVYPNYQSVIPAPGKFNYDVTVDRRVLIKSLDRLILFANESSNLAVMNVADNTIRLTASDYDFALDAEETVPCDFTKAKKTLPDFRIGVQAFKLASLLKQLTCQQALLRFVDDRYGFVIIPLPQPDNKEVTMLLIPMLTNN